MKNYFIFLISAVLIIASCALSDNLSYHILLMSVMPSSIAMWWMSSSFVDMKMTKWVLTACMISNMLLLSYLLYCIFAVSCHISGAHAVGIISTAILAMLVLMLCGVAVLVSDVKSVMKNGSVWLLVSLVVDVVYLVVAVIAAAAAQCGCPAAGLLLMAGYIAGIGIRESASSKFIICKKLERVIVETMKVASIPSAVGSVNVEEAYRELYERIVEYFEQNKPYLDNELTINTIVTELYSNKVYISKAISMFTGRNFCQFVNYYRVMHSMECFRANVELRVHELALQSGFNSVVSYNMAFRLFMSETPGEWCKKEKRMLKKK